MRKFSVSSRGLPTVDVRGANWLAALGAALHDLGRDEGLERLACEVLPNGTVIAREIRTGTGFVVQEVADDRAESEAPSDAAGLAEHLAAIAGASGRDAACQLAVEAARAVVPAESAAALLEEHGVLRFAAAGGPHAAKLIGLRLPRDAGVAGYCIEQRRSLVVDDVSAEPRHSPDVDHLTGYRTRALACVPVPVDDRIVGVIELLNPPDDGRFSRQHVFDLQAIAAALGRRLGRASA